MFSGVDIKKEMSRYRAGLASAPIAGFMVTYNKHTLGLEDLGTLEEQNWLNDQVKKGKALCSFRNCYENFKIPSITWILLQQIAIELNACLLGFFF